MARRSRTLARSRSKTKLHFIGAIDLGWARTAFYERAPRDGVDEELRFRQLPLCHALLVKQAELWLKLGEPTQAVRQLISLPGPVQKNSWVLKVQLAAIRACREQAGRSKDQQ